MKRPLQMTAAPLVLLLGLMGMLYIPLVFASLPTGDNAIKETPQEDTVDGIIIKFRDTLLKGKAAADLAVELGRVNGVTLKYKREMSGDAHVLSLDKSMPVSQVEEIATKLARDPRVLYAEPDYRMHTQSIPRDAQ